MGLAGSPLREDRSSNPSDAIIVSAEGKAPAIVFVMFLCLVLVGLEPFAVRDLQKLRTLGSGEGNVFRQVLFSVMFLSALFLSLRAGLNPLNALPASFILLLLWCLASAAWALEPDISVRRLGLTVIVAMTGMSCVQLLGAERALTLLKTTLSVILIISFVSIPIVPQAVHLPGEFDPALVGNWRGIFWHKNAAGPVTAVAALIFLFYARTTRKLTDWLLLAGAAIFLVGTRSKTALGFFVVCLFASFVYEKAAKNRAIERLLGPCILICIVLVAALFVVLPMPDFMLIDEPAGFTGRVGIWTLVLSSIQERIWLGYGFGSFWEIGLSSPTLRWGGYWVMWATHSHNGYLEAWVTVGAVGLLLMTAAFVLLPLGRLLSGAASTPRTGALFLALFLFFALHDLLETSYMYRAAPMWGLFTVILALHHQVQGRTS